MTVEESRDVHDVLDDLAHDRAFLGHPKGLGYLAFTEAWERFSFYGMQALLVLFMTAGAASAEPKVAADAASQCVSCSWLASPCSSSSFRIRLWRWWLIIVRLA